MAPRREAKCRQTLKDDTQLDIFSDALSSVMEDDSGYNTRLSTWESAESANNNQLRQRRRQPASSPTEDGEVRAEVNGRREGRKKSTTSTETPLPKSTNTYNDASARPIFGRVADHHAEERTAMKRPTSLQLIPTRDIQPPTDKVLPPSAPGSSEISTMGLHAQEPAELQQRLEAIEEQPRRVSAEEIHRELDEIRRLGKLVKDLDEATVLESDTGSGLYLARHVGLVRPLMDATFEQTVQQPEAQSYGRQGYSYGIYPEETGLYGHLKDANGMNVGGTQRREAYLYGQRDSASGAYPDYGQQPLAGVQSSGRTDV